MTKTASFLSKPFRNINKSTVWEEKCCLLSKQQSPFGTKICSDICPRTLSVPRSEQFSESEARGKLSTDKYPSIFSPQMEAVFVFLQIFFATRAVLKIGEYTQMFPSFSWGNIWSRDALRPIAREQKDLMDYN